MTADHDPAWERSDAPDENDKDPTETLTARVDPWTRQPTQIVLDGCCPRCGHS
jgi:hypothetical protein